IKKNLQTGESNCVQNLRLLKATTNALKKFGQAYVEYHLDNCLLAENVDPKALDKELKSVVDSVFSM
ncbi:MAG: metal-sensing transcriptional repressor, partial [Leptospiraceae bacterium]|nr:metal-sensing transcriptional repressor [Leptospiraceae bacterium]